jgi:hypothetical protein
MGHLHPTLRQRVTWTALGLIVAAFQMASRLVKDKGDKDEV